MQQTQKTASPTAQDYQKMWGDRILRTGLGGLGLGAGAASLYYLARNLSTALKQQDDEEEAKPAVDAPLGATAMPEAEKASGLYDDATTAVGKMLPDSFVNTLSKLVSVGTPGVKNDFDPNVMRSSFGTAATVGAGLLGPYAGWKAIQAIQENKKKNDRAQMVADAEKEYYDALTGNDHKLDNVYSKVAEKAASEKVALLDAVTGTWDALKRLPSAAGAAYVSAGLGLGGLAGKLLYDRALAESKAKAVAEAAKSRARISGILPTYVDPEELVSLKRRVESADQPE
jgi:hypothetical protein